MTEHPPPSSPNDELVTAVIDGEASTAEMNKVFGDPALTIRLAELTAARDALARPVDPLSELDQARLIRAAMESAFIDHSPTEAGSPLDSVGLRSKPRSRTTRTPRILAIAAAVVLIVLAVPLVARLTSSDPEEDQLARTAVGSDSRSDEAASGDLSFDDAVSGEEGASTADSAEASRAGPDVAEKDMDQSTSGLDPQTELGDFQTLDALRASALDYGQALLYQAPFAFGTWSSRDPDEHSLASCWPSLLVPDGEVVLIGQATLAGATVTFRVWKTVDVGLEVEVRHVPTCGLLGLEP